MRVLTLIIIFLLCQVVALLSCIRMLWSIAVNRERAWTLAKAYDRLGNAVFNDGEVQTISSRAQKAKLAGKTWGCILCRLLDRIQPNHCKNSVEGKL